MGAWGTSSFENDGALDMLAEYGEAGLVVVSDALQEVTGAEADEYIEVDQGQYVIAAAEIIAACHGKPADGIEAETLSSLTAHQAEVNEQAVLIKTAQDALSRIAVEGTSELFELWEEADAGDNAAFLAGFNDLKQRLGAL